MHTDSERDISDITDSNWLVAVARIDRIVDTDIAEIPAEWLRCIRSRTLHDWVVLLVKIRNERQHVMIH